MTRFTTVLLHRRARLRGPDAARRAQEERRATRTAARPASKTTTKPAAKSAASKSATTAATKPAAHLAAGTTAHPTAGAHTRKPVKRAAPVKPLPPPDPIHVAIENSNNALTPFYQALADNGGAAQLVACSASSTFGDSHVAADILTRDFLRDEFQSRFGDAGRGAIGFPAPSFGDTGAQASR